MKISGRTRSTNDDQRMGNKRTYIRNNLWYKLNNANSWSNAQQHWATLGNKHSEIWHAVNRHCQSPSTELEIPSPRSTPVLGRESIEILCSSWRWSISDPFSVPKWKTGFQINEGNKCLTLEKTRLMKYVSYIKVSQLHAHSYPEMNNYRETKVHPPLCAQFVPSNLSKT